MKIVIVGDGKVGYKLAKQLSEEDYDIVLVDQNEGKLKEALNTLDIFCITGDGADVRIQREADVQAADLFIACASTDELNMLSCLIARRLGAKHTIARVRNPIYYHQIDVLKEDLRLSMTINPEFAVAARITRLLIYPEAANVETFVKDRVELLELPVKETNPMIGVKLTELYNRYKIKVLVCAVKRCGQVMIPDGEFMIQEGDKLYIAAPHEAMKTFFRSLGKKEKIKNVLICGGGRVSYYLTHRLTELGMNVKIIERNYEKCEWLNENLPKAMVIHGDAGDHKLLMEEGIRETDAVVALTGMDEENIITSLYANQQGVAKVIAKVNDDSRMKMVEGLGIDSIVSAKTITADAIISYIRARQNSLDNANVETMYQLVEGEIEALEFLVKKKASYTDVPLRNLGLETGNLIACIGRNRKIIIPDGNDTIRVGDSVVVVTMKKHVQCIEEILK